MADNLCLALHLSPAMLFGEADKDYAVNIHIFYKKVVYKKVVLD